MEDISDQVPAAWPTGQVFPGCVRSGWVAAGNGVSVEQGPAGLKVEFHCEKCSREIRNGYHPKVKGDRLIQLLQQLEDSGLRRGVIAVNGDGKLRTVLVS